MALCRDMLPPYRSSELRGQRERRYGSRDVGMRTRPSSDELANTLSLTGLTDKLYTASMCRNTFSVSLLEEQQSSKRQLF
ncbi:hypothetical protein EYF80_024141 [Liparis tanakae]|uniref:Uncharacterized protein n=1 Tax=Liparis tanakae TaxID=230148 RepID=A0A4Z2HLF3_9TELE|nr:hypothetical protein EYF80_024141 [Liparis tanakae]